MFGSSSNSANTKTPGAEVASWTSFAAAAPFAAFDISMKGSSLDVKFDPRSMVATALSLDSKWMWPAS